MTSTYGQQQQADQQGGMVVCGDDGSLAGSLPSYVTCAGST
ncbi:hypothetical protein [Streptomyces sp. NPDC051704]